MFMDKIKEDSNSGRAMVLATVRHSCLRQTDIVHYQKEEAMQKLDLRFAHLRLHFRAREFMKLPPYKGSTFRGAFGVTFKRTVCIVQHRDCERCLIRNQCVYPYVFDTPVTDAEGIFRGFSEAPHPYVIEPPLETKTDYAPGDAFTLGLTLIGKALDHLPYFIYTFHRMGETGVGRGRGKCDLISGEAQKADGTWVPVYDGATEVLQNEVPHLCAMDFMPDQVGSEVRLSFVTPTQLKVDRVLQRGLDFPVLVRGLLRRCSSLAAFHGDGSPDLNYGDLIAQAETVQTAYHDLTWRTWERFSNRKNQRMKVSGFTGDVVFEGDLKPLYPLLALGVPLHVGKWTSFGMGQYELM